MNTFCLKKKKKDLEGLAISWLSLFLDLLKDVQGSLEWQLSLICFVAQPSFF